MTTVDAVYPLILDRWNGNDAAGFAVDGCAVGFDGS